MNENYPTNKIIEDEFGRKSGILLVNKPKGITSHDVVDQVRKIYGTKQVGHAGTLDPFAEGLLIILVGKATKASDSFLNLDKEYIAEIFFGKETTTGDPEGKVVDSLDEFDLDEEKLLETLKSFEGKYSQVVPVFSSVKVNGQKLRKVAAAAKSFEVNDTSFRYIDEKGNENEITLPRKDLVIQEIKLVAFDKNVANVLVSCSKGTYIRQLAIDLGRKLKIPAMLLNLKRTKIGEYDLKDAMSLEAP